MLSHSPDPMKTQQYVETFAYFAAGCFFLYKILTGYLMTNLNIALTTSRQHSMSQQDHLVVLVKLEKGDRGSINLHDCQVRITWNGHQVIKPLLATDRRSKKIEHFNRSKRNVINWEVRSVNQPFLHLTPGERSHFATYFDVPANVICEIEVAILAMKPFGFRVGQWRASTISLPVQTTTSNKGDGRKSHPDLLP